VDGQVTRRDLNWLMAKAAATIAGSAFLQAWGAAAQGPRREYKPEFFSDEEYALLDRFTDLLIPADDTPGARDAQAAQFIDFLIFSAHEYAPEMQTEWKATIGWFNGKELNTELMTEISQPGHDGHDVFQTMKQLTVYAYYTSRAGLIDDLQYKGVAYLTAFPPCTHPEHRSV
jgi:hypothetical protein